MILKNEDPIYIAIILEQGKFSWENAFIESLDNALELTNSLNKSINKLKPATKALVFKQWKAHLSFDNHLESLHG